MTISFKTSKKSVQIFFMLGLVLVLTSDLSRTADAGLVVNERLDVRKTLRKEIEADPEVLTENDAPLRPSETAKEPTVKPRKPFKPRFRPVAEAETGTRSDAGPSLNEIQLRKIQMQHRFLAESKPVKKDAAMTTVPGYKPAPKSSSNPARVAPMQTEVIVKDPMKAPVKKPVQAPNREVNPSTDDFVEEAARGPEPNAAFPYTHLLPSPMNIPGGTWVFGTGVAVGVTDFLQISTNVLRDVTRYWNVQAKVPLIEFPTFISSFYLNWDTFNLNNFDSTNPDVRVTTWQPGLVTGYEISESMAFFVGGNFNATSKTIPTDRIQTSGYSRGARLETDLSWLYNPQSSRLADNALSAGVVYDFTYKLVGFGVTHHWPTFEFGLHYTLNADNYRVMPIFNISSGFTF